MLFSKEMLDTIGKRLIGSKQTLALAESVTSGLLQTAFSGATNASCFFHGGITAYNLGQKYRHLLVEPIQANACDCVSETVTSQMAQGVCRLFRSDFGIAITGYATTVPEKGIDTLYAWVCISQGDRILLMEKLYPGKSEGFEAQLSYAQQVLTLFHNLGH